MAGFWVAQSFSCVNKPLATPSASAPEVLLGAQIRLFPTCSPRAAQPANRHGSVDDRRPTTDDCFVIYSTQFPAAVPVTGYATSGSRILRSPALAGSGA